ncbi:universal stress protein [Rhodococcus sp. 14-2483-1-1]|nr:MULTISPECIES: universal stress protein [unclassified Rhodococcus (in: high G+C Gram-positive bacteria)]OZE85855.1 universal stress protein [Rhodococcus sp. 15-649-2-2]OZF40671.1 universal stress protein [Rhodococcus sp. 14-2483-1-1]QII03179.1 universal stress protein [Rhodococcus fascians A21d2]QII09090.1 universal stress protein [Rhodococcus fascians A25f]OZC84079.1 universal stress protein [Rhodococcus sp. 06-412-2C]
MSNTPEGHEALRRGAAEAELRGAQLIVLSVVDRDSVSAEDRSAAQAEVERTLPGASTTVRVEPDGGDPAGALVDLVADVGAGMVVIGSKRRSAVGKFLMGSTVQRVLLDCPVPVLVVKAP